MEQQINKQTNRNVYILFVQFAFYRFMTYICNKPFQALVNPLRLSSATIFKRGSPSLFLTHIPNICIFTLYSSRKCKIIHRNSIWLFIEFALPMRWIKFGIHRFFQRKKHLHYIFHAISPSELNHSFPQISNKFDTLKLRYIKL